jgi:hypothetical protein
MGCKRQNSENELIRITKCDEEDEVLFCKVTKKATVAECAMYNDNEDVSGITLSYLG